MFNQTLCFIRKDDEILMLNPSVFHNNQLVHYEQKASVDVK